MRGRLKTLAFRMAIAVVFIVIYTVIHSYQVNNIIQEVADEMVKYSSSLANNYSKCHDRSGESAECEVMLAEGLAAISTLNLTAVDRVSGVTYTNILILFVIPMLVLGPEFKRAIKWERL